MLFINTFSDLKKLRNQPFWDGGSIFLHPANSTFRVDNWGKLVWLVDISV